MPKWLFYSLLTVLFWGAWGALAKAVANIPGEQSQALSTLGILPIMLAVALSPGWRHGERKLRGSTWAFLAGVLVGLGNIALYKALAAETKVAIVVPLTALYPVVTVILAILLLRERPGWLQVAGVAASLAAIYLLSPSPEPASPQIILDSQKLTPERNVSPSVAPPSAWLAYSLASIALWGVASLVMKLATRDVSAEGATFWFLAAFVPLAAVLLARGPARWPLPAREWLMVALLGATYGLGNLTLLAAYRGGGKASVVTPLSALYPVVTIPLAMAAFEETVSGREGAGIALALAAAVALSREGETQGEPPGSSRRA